MEEEASLSLPSSSGERRDRGMMGGDTAASGRYAAIMLGAGGGDDRVSVREVVSGDVREVRDVVPPEMWLRRRGLVGTVTLIFTVSLPMSNSEAVLEGRPAPAWPLVPAPADAVASPFAAAASSPTTSTWLVGVTPSSRAAASAASISLRYSSSCRRAASLSASLRRRLARFLRSLIRARATSVACWAAATRACLVSSECSTSVPSCMQLCVWCACEQQRGGLVVLE